MVTTRAFRTSAGHGHHPITIGVLSKLGFSRVDAVGNGAEAVQALTNIPYDLVFMDVQMPELDGLAATRMIRAQYFSVTTHQLPIIAMTAHATQSDRDRCMAAGMNDYITKPIMPDALREVLHRWLPDASQPVARHPRADGSVDTGGDTPPPIFDHATLLARVLGDTQLVRTIADKFLEDLPHTVEKLQVSLTPRRAPRSTPTPSRAPPPTWAANGFAKRPPRWRTPAAPAISSR